MSDEFEIARQWAINAALRWSDKDADNDELQAAAYAADAADYASYAAYAAYATADAAYATAYAAYATADAAYATADAAYATAYAARKQTFKDAADIVRAWFPKVPKLNAKEGSSNA
jgi:hypothetical protein